MIMVGKRKRDTAAVASFRAEEHSAASLPTTGKPPIATPTPTLTATPAPMCTKPPEPQAYISAAPTSTPTPQTMIGPAPTPTATPPAFSGKDAVQGLCDIAEAVDPVLPNPATVGGPDVGDIIDQAYIWQQSVPVVSPQSEVVFRALVRVPIIVAKAFKDGPSTVIVLRRRTNYERSGCIVDRRCKTRVDNMAHPGRTLFCQRRFARL